MSEPTWLAADLEAASDLSPSSRGERMRHSPQNTHSKEDDGKNEKKQFWSFICSYRCPCGTNIVLQVLSRSALFCEKDS